MSNQVNDEISSESGVERGVRNHPLRVMAESSSIASGASSSYAAELVQSAARSLLDASPTLMSDDESDEQASPSSSAALSSLQTETLPALPNVQDRKRFIVRET